MAFHPAVARFDFEHGQQDLNTTRTAATASTLFLRNLFSRTAVDAVVFGLEAGSSHPSLKGTRGLGKEEENVLQNQAFNVNGG